MSFRPRGAALVAGVGAALLLAACSDGPASVASPLAPKTKPSAGYALPRGCTTDAAGTLTSCDGLAGDGVAAREQLQVCKYYPQGTGPAVQVVVDVRESARNHDQNTATKNSPTHLTYLVQPNSCVIVWQNGQVIGPDADTVDVAEIVPAGYTASSQVTTIVRNNATLGDTDPTHLVTTPGPVAATANVANVIIGGTYVSGALVVFRNTPTPPPTYAIGDRVWNDVNGDGVQDAGEPGLDGLTVTATNAANVVVGTATTAGDGGYGIANLPAGTYGVCVSGAPAGYAASYDLDGIATASCAKVVVSASRSDVDFGYKPPRYTLGGTVWNDADANGANNGESGIGGVTVQITNVGTGAQGTTTTAPNGTYAFSNLLAGQYTVCTTAGVPAGFTQTYDLDFPATPDCATVTVAGNTSNVDFGYTPPRYSIGDRVWNDGNANGMQDAGESGLTGLTVTVTNAANVVVATTTTGANGAYTVPNIVAGSYTVCVSGVAAGFVPTYDLDGTGTAGCATITVSGNRSDVDFGYAQPSGQVGDRAWIDANGNGRQDAGEPGLPGVTITLGGAASGSLTTSATGTYTFAGLGAGTYTVTAATPSGFVPTTVAAAGTTNGTDSNLNPSSVLLASLTSTDFTVDFGFVPRAGAGQGCTPGYWKQAQHFDSWKWYAQGDMVDATFGVTYRSLAKNNPSGALTLLQALELNGNTDSEALFRIGTAALLNAVYQSGVSYPYTAPQILSMVRTAWLSGDPAKWNATKDVLDKANNASCPLN